MDKKLAKIYYTPSHPASFSTVEKLWQATDKKFSKKKINEWLQKQYTYTRHKPRRIHFRRNCYNISNIGDLWECDLAEFSTVYSTQNKGVKYLLGSM